MSQSLPPGPPLTAVSPPTVVEIKTGPNLLIRAIWFVLVGWWLGALWVILAWSVLLLPYPFPQLIRDLLADLPSVMTLAWPERDGPPEAVPA